MERVPLCWGPVREAGPAPGVYREGQNFISRTPHRHPRPPYRAQPVNECSGPLSGDGTYGAGMASGSLVSLSLTRTPGGHGAQGREELPQVTLYVGHRPQVSGTQRSGPFPLHHFPSVARLPRLSPAPGCPCLCLLRGEGDAGALLQSPFSPGRPCLLGRGGKYHQVGARTLRPGRLLQRT